MQSSSPSVSIIVVTYNNENDISDCLDSILSQDYNNFEVIVVDNASADRTVQKAEEVCGKDKRVKVIRSDQNTGYAGGNNLGFQHSKGELVVLLNPDLVVSSGWLVHLVQAFDKCGDSAGIICSNVLLFDRKDTINACGNVIHLAGFVFSRFYMEEESRCHECDDDALRTSLLKTGDETIAVPIAAPSGASMMFSRASLQKIGRSEPFDTRRFFMEYSDIDLAIDFLSHGLFCYVAPKSKVFHKFRFKMNHERLATLEKGRYQILGHLTSATRFSMFSALLLAEAVVWAFILGKSKDKGRMIRSKFGTYAWLVGNNISRPDNSKIKDLKIIEVMSSNLIIYDEMAFGKGSDERSNIAHSFSNKLFARSRERIMNSLRG